jgi:hypothetical protein
MTKVSRIPSVDFVDLIVTVIWVCEVSEQNMQSANLIYIYSSFKTSMGVYY